MDWMDQDTASPFSPYQSIRVLDRIEPQRDGPERGLVHAVHVPPAGRRISHPAGGSMGRVPVGRTLRSGVRAARARLSSPQRPPDTTGPVSLTTG